MGEVREIARAMAIAGLAIDDLADGLVEYLEALNEARGDGE